MTDQTQRDEGLTRLAWLVEAPGMHYLAVRTLGRPEFYWTRNHDEALQFASKDQADQTAMAIRSLVPDLWGFAPTLGEAWSREHKWVTFVKSEDMQVALKGQEG